VFVDGTKLTCTVPPVQYPQIVPFSLLTIDNYKIESRALNFTYRMENMIESIYPNTSDVNGGIEFRLTGNFEILSFDPVDFTLLWDGVDITSAYLNLALSSQSVLVGILPPSTDQRVGVTEIQIKHNSITYQNYSCYFTYAHAPVVNDCFPPLGPSRGGTIVVIQGSHFNEDTMCLFDDYLEIHPIRDGKTPENDRLLCEMPPHHSTGDKSLKLKTWKNQKVIDTSCTFRYHLDPSIKFVDPQHFYTGNI
jgi:hypothetical protein